MRIRVWSDLHLEMLPEKFWPIPDVEDIDVFVLAGDISSGTNAFKWIDAHLSHLPVIYIAGNHEFYGRNLGIYNKLKKFSDLRENVHFLQNDSVIINDVNFLGCTLWTSFELLGNSPVAKIIAQVNMSDYRYIRVPPSYRKLRADDTLAMYLDSLTWLEDSLPPLSYLPTVVVTHHAPSTQSIDWERYGTNDLLNAAYASDLEGLIHNIGPDLWLHGHVHTSRDYRVNDTRVVCNPRGYNGDNWNFKPEIVLEI